MQRIPKYTAGMFKKKMPRFGSSSIKMPRMPKPPKPRVKKFAEGGLGYEEDPQPGVQSDREDKPKKPAKKDKPRTAQSKPRSMSNEEFIEKYKDSPASNRVREEASKSVKKDKASRAASGTRMDFGGVSFGDPEMTRDEQESIAKNTLEVVKGAAAIGAAGPVARGLQTAKRRYDIGRRVDAMTENQQKTAMMRAAREAREVDGMRSGGQVKKYAGGGSVSSASKRADGCVTKGKTRGKFV
jgi:hypothetical protein